MAVVLRPYQQEDFTQVVDLFHLNTPAYFCPEELFDLENFLKTQVQYYTVLADSNKIVASGGCNVKNNIGWLSWYIVHPEFQSQGYGATLVRHNLDLLRHAKVAEIQVRTSQLVYQFYEKFGFELYYTEENYWGKDMHLYQMRFAPA